MIRVERRRGFFLVFILLMTVIVLMMVGSILTLNRQSQYNTTYHSKQIAALEAAEAGSVDVIKQLQNNRAWAPTTAHSVALTGQKASYRIQFGPTPSTTDPDLSVNNLAGDAAVDGPRGVGSVPPHSAFLVIDGFSGEARQRLEILVKPSPFADLESPLVTSGRQFFDGSVAVEGIRDFDDITPVDADIHSNSQDTSSARVTWTSQSGEVFRVEGEVSTSADTSAAAAFDLNSGSGTVDVHAQEASSGTRPFPDLDIEETISNAQGPAHTPVIGLNTIDDVRRNPGNLTIQGDLVLDGGQLFVGGNLTVNGSISGEGSVYVRGNTQFWGDSKVNVSEGHIALYSRGNVTLDGFNGTAFLGSLGPAVEYDFQKLELALDVIADELENNSGSWNVTNIGLDEVDAARALIGQDTTGEDPTLYQALDPYVTGDSYMQAESVTTFTDVDGNTAGNLRAHLQSLLPSADAEDSRTINFVVAKLDRLKSITASKGNIFTVAPQPVVDQLNQYMQDGVVFDGILDYVNDAGNAFGIAGARLEGELRNYTFSSIGTSYFRGVLYSNGAILCQNEVEVLGGVYVEENRFTDPALPALVAPSPIPALQAGDVAFTSGSRLTYVEGLLEQSPAYSENNLLNTVYWSTPSGN